MEGGANGASLSIGPGTSLQPIQAGSSAVTDNTTCGTVINCGTIAAASGVEAEVAGGDGVLLCGFGCVANAGLILGGSSGFSNQNAQQGGTGVDLSGVGIVSNTGTIVGGGGGGSTNRAANGGFALRLQNGGCVTNIGEIIGGNAGVDAISGGEGGVGLMLGGKSVVTNIGVIQAGAGADITGLGESTGSGPAVQFEATGILINSGTIGQQDISSIGVVASGEIEIDNSGDIFGLSIQDGGTLRNSGLICGEDGCSTFQGLPNPGGAGIFVASAASISNAGTITGGNGCSGGSFGGAQGGIGLSLEGAKDYLVNSGEISGGEGSTLGNGLGGAGLSLGSYDIAVNQGSIVGGAGNCGDGIELSHGLLINSGTISGGGGASVSSCSGDGAYIDGGILIAQSGIIEGGTYGEHSSGRGFAVKFGDTAAGTLVINPDARFYGAIQASEISPDTLILAGTAPGEKSGFGEPDGINNFNAILLTNGSHWSLTGTISTPSIRFEGSSWLALTTATNECNVYFSTVGEDELVLSTPSSFDGLIDDFAMNDVIFLNGVLGKSLEFQHNDLFILGSSGETLATLAFQGNYEASDFAIKMSTTQTEITCNGSCL
jgi:hypothetical protein